MRFSCEVPLYTRIRNGHLIVKTRDAVLRNLSRIEEQCIEHEKMVKQPHGSVGYHSEHLGHQEHPLASLYSDAGMQQPTEATDSHPFADPAPSEFISSDNCHNMSGEKAHDTHLDVLEPMQRTNFTVAPGRELKDDERHRNQAKEPHLKQVLTPQS